jgi:hypothetical protein
VFVYVSTELGITMNGVTTVILLVTLYQNTIAQNVSTLQLVQVVFRHGDRTPAYTYPSDPYKEFWEHVGLGILTKEGMEQHYELGEFFRDRYGQFLGTKYDAKQLYVRSTDIDRTLQSAYCNLAGLFPPEPDQVWNPNLLWQPIPVHTEPDANDTLLEMFSYCPQYDVLDAQLQESTDYQQMMGGFTDLFAILSRETGENVTTLEKLWEIFDVIRVERLYNFTLASWALDNYNEMQEAAQMDLVWICPTIATQRLRGGPLLGEMIGNMQEKINSSTEMNLFMFSAHDSTIAALLSALDMYNGLLVPYAATVMVELHRLDRNYYVQILYRNDTTVDPYVLVVPGCTELCPIIKFQQLTASVVPLDIDAECQIQDPSREQALIEYRSKTRYQFS